MAGRWSASPMKATSAGSSSTADGKRQCPYCHVPLVRIQSKQEATKGQFFLKCPYNIKGDDTTCPFIRSEKEYEALEASERQVQTAKSASIDCYTELKEELGEMKQTLDSVVSEVWKLKVLQPTVQKPEQKHIVMDLSVFLGFVGVLIAVVVACILK